MFKKTRITRMVFFLLGDVCLLFLSLYLSMLMRFEWDIPPYYNRILLYSIIFVAIKIPIFMAFRLYSMTWSYVGIYEMVDIVKATLVSQAAIAIFIYLIKPFAILEGFPRSVVLADFVLSTGVICLFRLSKRIYFYFTGESFHGKKRTLIVGAGNAGEMIVRDMRRHNEGNYAPIGFVDDNAIKKGNFIQGVKVLGPADDIPRIVEEHGIETILIAIPSATNRDMQKIMGYVRRSEVKDVKVLPGMQRIINDSVALSDVKEIDIEDIIGREQVAVDKNIIQDFIKGKKVLITGAGGSIGSEIVRQVIRGYPKFVLALDADETDLFNLEQELKSFIRETPLYPVVADIRDKVKIEHIFGQYTPEIVLHAAAYKHVPMMELYPEEALKVNVFGTLNVIEESVRHGVDKFIMISSDKAVNPTSIMGATKRVAEELVKFYNARMRGCEDAKRRGERNRGCERSGRWERNNAERNHQPIPPSPHHLIPSSTRFISVRFGNVVGSRGSVIPIFKSQIAKGGPVTVTHKDMKRYFMSIPEAVALVLQAGAMGEGGRFLSSIWASR